MGHLIVSIIIVISSHGQSLPTRENPHTRLMQSKHINYVYSLEHTTRSFPSRNIAFGSCICFEEQSLLYCDSLRPIRYVMDPFFTLSGVLNYNANTILQTETHTHILSNTHHHTLKTRVDVKHTQMRSHRYVAT